MSAPQGPRPLVDLDALAGMIADQLGEPTYCLDVAVTGNSGDGFVRFDTRRTSAAGVDEVTIGATVEFASDGEDEITVEPGETYEIVVRRVPR